MLEEVKTVWLYDPNNGNRLAGTKIVDADYQLGDGETFVVPDDGLYEPIHFDLAKQAWVGVTKEEWDQANPAPAVAPTPQQEMMASVMKDLAAVKNDGQSQDKLNANVMKQVAQLTIANTTKDKVSAQLMKDVANFKIQLNELNTQISSMKEAQSQSPESSQASVQSSDASQPAQASDENTQSAQPNQQEEE